MNNHTYWHKQSASEPLYPDFEWIKPEQKTKAGIIGIVGGQKMGFVGLSEAYNTCVNAGAGEVRVLVPDTLKKMIPPHMDNIIYGPTNHAGSLAKDGLKDLIALGNSTDVMLFVGDAGMSSETSITYEKFISSHEGPVVITRDAFDILRESNKMLINRQSTLLVLSFAQLQKLFKLSYYPIIITFNMQLYQLVEALHKFTITYPVTLAVLHKDTLVIAHGGEVVTTEWNNPMAIWRGNTASKMATYWLWKPSDPLMCFASSVI